MDVTHGSHNHHVLPFTRETPDRMWLGFVNEVDEQPTSVLTRRVLPMLAVAGLGLLVLSGGKPEHEEPGPPPSSAAAAYAQAPAVGAPTQTPADIDAAPVDAPPPVDVPPAQKPAEAQPAPSTEPTSLPPSQSPAPDVAPVPAPETEKPKHTPKPPKPLSAAAARKATRAAAGLRTAVKEGRVKTSRDNFAVISADSDEVGWQDAKRACAELGIDGVAGWRLPSRGEARELNRGKASPPTAYWTRQRGPHDDTIYVYDPRTRRSSPWLDQEIASVVCVQPKPR